MLIVRLYGGLGNQMFQFATAYALSKQHSLDLKLDISWFKTQTLRAFELGQYNIDPDFAAFNEIPFGINQKGIKRFAFNTMLKIGLRSLGDIKYIKESDEIIIDHTKINYLDGYWQNEKYFLNYSEEIREKICLNYDLSEKHKSISQILDSEKTVSIHIRRGDYVTNIHTNQFHGVCPLRYYKTAIDFFIKKLHTPCFLVFSDDIAWAKTNLNFDKDVYFVENIDFPHEDIILMSQCNHNIIANSSFSWWGAWLNANENKIVIAPKEWFRNEKRNRKTKELIPQNWIRF